MPTERYIQTNDQPYEGWLRENHDRLRYIYSRLREYASSNGSRLMETCEFEAFCRLAYSTSN